MHVCVFVCMHKSISVSAFRCVCVCMCVYVCLYVCVFYIEQKLLVLGPYVIGVEGLYRCTMLNCMS